MAMTGVKREAVGRVAGTRAGENSPGFCQAEAEIEPGPWAVRRCVHCRRGAQRDMRSVG